DREMTFRELRDAADRAATVFESKNVLPGDRVLVMTYNDPGFVVAMYGLWRMGAVLVPVNHKLTGPELEHIAGHSGAVLGIASEELVEAAREGAPGFEWMTSSWEGGTFDRAVDDAEPFSGPLAEDTEYAQILYTSGTTSAPKGCVHTHRGVSSIAPNVTANIHFTGDDRFLMAMPIWHASPLNNWLLTMMFVGATVVLMRDYDPAEFFPLMEREKITSVFGAPIAFIGPFQMAKAKGE